MKKIAFVFALLMGTTILAFAQHAKPSINFKTTTYDFGEINEEKGKVSYTFEFTNNGGQPLVVHNVSASCGCTTPEWSKMPIAPGGKGFVKATFDPTNRPGPFNKTITVSSNSEESTTILRIVGKVIPKPLTVEDTYPRQMGDIRLKAGHIAFTRVAPGTVKSESLEIINSGNAPAKIDFENVSAHLSMSVVPAVVPPGKTAVITANFDASKKDDWGFVVDQIFLVINGTKDYNNNRLSVSATIEEDFSAMTPDQIAKAAKAEYSDKNYDFGTVKDGEVVKHVFTVKNVGASNLILRKVKASCGCTAVQPDKNMLVPGETTNITAVFDSKGRLGRQNKSITVITNDPTASTVLLQITGEVVAQ